MKLDYTANNLAALDRFGRVEDQIWTDYGATPENVDHFSYGYDRVGNRLWKENDKAASLTPTPVHLDELYDYDGLDQLVSVDRGNLNVTQDGIVSGTEAFYQDWDLDGLGNWAGLDDDGTSQTRETNEANEIEEINSSDTHVAHDAAGNMIRVPKLDGSGDHFHLKYDAWNHLVEVFDDNGTTLIAEYQYDGTGRRIVKGVDDGSDGSLDTFTHFFHKDNQVIETREGDDVSGAAPAAENLQPKHQFIWSPRYIDSLILRDECDAQGDIITANRLYYLSDANYNVTALVDASGSVVERYLYTPYGEVTVLDDDFTSDADGKSDYDNTTLYTGRESDGETGLQYYRARYYHSELGRFVSRDPIGYDGEDFNLHRYVENQPMTSFDPFGLKKLIIIYVDQPGSGGDDDTYEGMGECGHTFIEIKDTNSGETTGKLGYYPSKSVNPIAGPIKVPGKIRSDKNHIYDLSKSFPLTDEQYKKGLESVLILKKKPGSYDLNNNNCTDAAITIAGKCGIILPDPQGKWPGGGGSNPGCFGEALRKMPGGCSTPKQQNNGCNPDDGGSSKY